MAPSMHRLVNVVKPYAWGSRTQIAELLGLPSPSAGPEAELWMGAHPASPSRIVEEGAEARALDSCIAHAPLAHLGETTLRAFGPKLPFLLKVLAAASPLSLQAHPNAAQAEAGFARENAAGIALDAPTRSYKDASHKPEVLCALTPFWALSGFRRAKDAARVFRATGAPHLAPYADVLETKGDGDALREVFLGLFASEEKRAIAEEVTTGAAALAAAGFVDEAEWTSRLAREYPGDVGIAVALLLNLVKLSPGQALFLDAGNLHAYLEGTGIELMASSDNVLRGGLTVKHVDVDGLAEVLEFRPTEVPYARRVATPDGAIVYRTTAAEFSLSRVEVDGARSLTAATGPQIVLVTRGACDVRRGDEVVHVRRGESLYVRHGDGPLELHGDATLFRATVP